MIQKSLKFDSTSLQAFPRQGNFKKLGNILRKQLIAEVFLILKAISNLELGIAGNDSKIARLDSKLSFLTKNRKNGTKIAFIRLQLKKGVGHV